VTNTIKWTSTVTNRLLVEAGYSSNLERYNNLYEPGVEKPYGSPEWYAGARHADTVLGISSNAALYQRGVYPDRYNAGFGIVCDRRRIKFGFQVPSRLPAERFANADLYQNYLNGAPSTVTLLATPAHWRRT
jgi:hypothetical protein